MRKYVVLWLGVLLLSSLATMAQVASGNASESANPRTDPITAQNFNNYRTVEGCLARPGSDYVLVPKRGRPVLLNSRAGEDLGQHAGHYVKVRGNETMTQANDDTAGSTNYEIAVERVDLLSESCPAGWNERWMNEKWIGTKGGASRKF